MGKHQRRRRGGGNGNRNKKRHQEQGRKNSSEQREGEGGEGCGGNRNNDNKGQQQQLLQRLRHADSETRRAALSAVLHNPRLLRKGGGGKQQQKRQQLQLLNVVRERLMDDDDEYVECAVVAAGCLCNYLAASPRSSGNDNDSVGNNNNEEKEKHYLTSTAGWLPLFLRKIDDSLRVLQDDEGNADNMTMVDAADTTKTANKTKTKSARPAYLELLKRCLECTVTLVETNPLVVEERLLSSSSSSSLLQDFVTVWDRCLDFAVSCRLRHRAEEGTGDPKNQFAAIDEAEAIVWIARGLHSSWDDNPALIEAWSESRGTGNSDTTFAKVSDLVSETYPIENNGTTTTNRRYRQALVHLAGAVMARAAVVKSDPPSERTLECAAKTLSCALFSEEGSDTGKSMLHMRLSSEEAKVAFVERDKQRSDEAMERDIVRAQVARHEPARMIARRLKEEKGERIQRLQEQQEQELKHSLAATGNNADDGGDGDGGDDDMNMGMVVDDHPKDPYSGKFEEGDRLDKAERLQKAERKWKDDVRPTQLALEILVNLTSTSPAPSLEEEGQDDVVMAEAGSDQPPPLDDRLARVLLAENIPDAVFSLLKEAAVGSDWWWSEECGPVSASTGSIMEATNHVPMLILSANDVVSKAALCLGHCITAMPEFCGSVDTAMMLWNDLRPVVQKMMQRRRTVGSDAGGGCGTVVVEDETLQAISGAMAVLVQSRPEIRQRVLVADAAGDDDNLNWLLSFLSSPPSSESSSTTPPPPLSPPALVKRDIISILGVLCSAELEASTSVRETVCSVLLRTTVGDEGDAMVSSSSSSASGTVEDKATVLSETMNALMDVFGGDDDETARLFRKLDVLPYFQRQVAFLRRAVEAAARAADSSSCGGGDDDDESRHRRQILLEQWEETAWNAERFIEYKLKTT